MEKLKVTLETCIWKVKEDLWEPKTAYNSQLKEHHLSLRDIYVEGKGRSEPASRVKARRLELKLGTCNCELGERYPRDSYVKGGRIRIGLQSQSALDHPSSYPATVTVTSVGGRAQWSEGEDGDGEEESVIVN